MNKKKIQDPKGDTYLHGNHARIDPKKDVVSEYKFYAGIQKDIGGSQANLPITDDANVKEIKRFGEINKK